MQHVSLRAAVAAALILAAGCSGGAGSNLAPGTTAQRPAAAAARNPGSLVIGPGGLDLYWSAQSIWVGDNHLCSDPATCSALERVPASANGATSNTALEIYPAAYPYPYGGIALSGSTLWYTSNVMAVVSCTITSGGACTLGTAIQGPATQLDYPEDVKLDPTGRPTVANTAGNSILTFDLGANGNAAPLRAIAGSNTHLIFPHGIAYDRQGNLWVSQANELLEFGPNANGNVAPIRTIVGNQTGLTSSRGIAVDRYGNVYVADEQTNRLAMFKESGLGSNVSPDDVWTNTALTHLNNPQYVAVDDFTIYVSNYSGNSISEFTIGSPNGHAAVRTITGSATTNPLGIALQ
jgi:Beta-propeller repeat